MQSTAANYYWILGTGDWNDATHWSTTSGGASCACVPGAGDNVFFDVNSFTSTLQVVTIDAASTCANMDWTGAAFSPTLDGDDSLSIGGSLKLITAMSFNYSGITTFQSTLSGNTIDAAGHSFNSDVHFNGSGGSWSLSASLFIPDMYIDNGDVYTNGYQVSISRFFSSGSLDRGFHLGASIVQISGSWNLDNSSSFTFDADQSTMVYGSPNIPFVGGDRTYHDVVITSTGATVYGNNVFHDLTFNGNAAISGTTTCHRLVVNGNANFDFGSGTAITELHVNGGCDLAGSTTIGTAVLNSYANLYNTNTITHLTVNGNAQFWSANTFDTLTLAAGMEYSFAASQFQTILSKLEAIGTCTKWIWFKSTLEGTTSIFTMPAGSATVQHVRLKDMEAYAPGVFNAVNSTSLGNTVNWNIAPPPFSTVPLYWVGGSGAWNDGLHWSYSSGGAPGACIPTPDNPVYFDNHSFTAMGQHVEIDKPAFCEAMDWVNVTRQPQLTGGGALYVKGYLYFNPGMTSSFYGPLHLQSDAMGSTVNTGGITFFNDIHFNGSGGCVLNGPLSTTGAIYLDRGRLWTNNRTINASRFYSTMPTIRELHLGSSVINLSDRWQISDTNQLIFDAQTSVINLNHAYAVLLSDALTYYDVNFTNPYALGASINGSNIYHDISFSGTGGIAGNTVARSVMFGGDGGLSGTTNIIGQVTISGQGIIQSANSQYDRINCMGSLLLGTTLGGNIINRLEMSGDGSVYGSNTIDTLVLHGGAHYQFEGNKSQTVKKITALGDCGHYVWVRSMTRGVQSTFTQFIGTVQSAYLQLRDMRGNGGASFIADNSIDHGNNQGWTFQLPTPKNLYWVGGSGNWNDPAHWSLTGGGTGNACVPTIYDNVYFNVSSFTGSGQTVVLDFEAYCRDMDWTGAQFNPTFSGSEELNIWGALRFISMMDLSATAPVYFKATSGVNSIFSAGQVFNNQVTFDGTGGWMFQDAFGTDRDVEVYFERGSLNTNDQPVSMGWFKSFTSNPRTLQLGSSVLTITHGWRLADYPRQSANLSLSAAASTINFSGDPWATMQLGSENHQYNNVHFLTPANRFASCYGNPCAPAIGGVNVTATFHDISFAGFGIVRLPMTANNISINGDGLIEGGFNANNITITGNASMSGTYTAHDVSIGGTGTCSNFLATLHRLTIGGTADVGLGVYGGFSQMNITRLELGADGTICGNNVIDSLMLTGGSTYTFGSGNTQTIRYLSADGSCSGFTWLRSTELGVAATLQSNSAAITVNFARLRDVHATGSSNFTATNSTDFGGNSGWTFQGISTQAMYWVGGAGNWNDPAHWSLSSGGVPGSCIPTPNNDVIFDQSSFSSFGQIVTVDAEAFCRSMTWASVLNAPELNGDNTLNIYGSLVLSPNMSFAFNGPVNFKSSITGRTISTSGQVFHNQVTFDGAGGWMFLDAFATDPSVTVYFERGSLNTGHQPFSMGWFSSVSMQPRTLQLGSSVLTITHGWRLADYPRQSANLSLSAAASTINFVGDPNASLIIGSENHYYGNVNFLTPAGFFHMDQGFQPDGPAVGGRSDYPGSATFHDIDFSGFGVIAGIVSANDISINGDGFLYGAITANNISITGNGTMSGNCTAHDVSIGATGTCYNFLATLHRLNIGGTADVGRGVYGGFSQMNITRLELGADGTICGNNVIDSLMFTGGSTYTFGSGNTQTIRYLSADGSCSGFTWLRSSVPGTAATLQSNSSTISVNFSRLRDVHATGSSSFIATNSTDFGGTSGWIFQGAATQALYWVGGTGLWSDPSHWSFTSGGTGGACVPSLDNDVIFDQNSFSYTFESVTIDAEAYCRSMTWTGVLYSPALVGDTLLNVYGSLTLSADMSFSFNGRTMFYSPAAGSTITMGGHMFHNNVLFDGAGGWIFQDAFATDPRVEVQFDRGSINTNSQSVAIGSFSSHTTVSKSLLLGTSVISLLNGNWDFSFSSNLSVSAAASTINFMASGPFLIPGNNSISFGNVRFFQPYFGGYGNEIRVDLSSPCSFREIVFDFNGSVYGSVSAQRVLMDEGGVYADHGQFQLIRIRHDASYNNYQGTVQHLEFGGDASIGVSTSIDSLLLNGGSRYEIGYGTVDINHISVTTGCNDFTVITANPSATIHTAAGSITLDYLRLSGIHGTGGAMFTAYNSIDEGGNSGWIFPAQQTRSLYWVGGTGDWNDSTHWSTVSGGSGGACIPTPVDDVYFDINSFSFGYESVNIQKSAFCRSMNWTGALQHPVMSGLGTLNIFGDLILINDMSVSMNGALYFKSKQPGRTITTAGNYLTCQVHFDGAGGSWTLQDDFKAPDRTIYLDRGELLTGNHHVQCTDFESYGNGLRSLVAGSSWFFVRSAWRVDTSSMLTIDCGTSKMLMLTETSLFYGGNHTYHDIIFIEPLLWSPMNWNVGVFGNNHIQTLRFDGQGVINDNNRIGTATFFGTAIINGRNRLESLQLQHDGYFYDSDTVGTLTLSAGHSYSLNPGFPLTLENQLVANGNAGAHVTVQSMTVGTQGIITSPAGTYCIDYIDLRDNQATGGAFFFAGSNSINLGNVTGWDFNGTFNAAVTKTDVTCGGLANGTATASAGGCTGSGTFLWSTGSTDATITGLAAGAYSVTVTGPGGQTVSLNVTISEVTPLQILGSATTDISCGNTSDGSVTINAVGGTPPLSYSIDGGTNYYTNGGVFYGLTDGSYSILVSDASGCNAVGATFQINLPGLLQTWYLDNDGDGYGDANGSGQASCTVVAGRVTDHSDCNDFDFTIHPGATEVCGDHVDNDCDGLIDEGCGFTSQLNLKVFLEAFYQGNGTMQAAIDPYLYPTVSDTLTVQLVQGTSPYALSKSKTVTVATDGNASLTFDDLSVDTAYYIVLRHRNSLETWSALPIQFQPVTYYDFTTACTSAYASNLAALDDGTFALHGADADQNGIIDLDDLNIVEMAGFNSSGGYVNEDLNGDGIVESADYSFVENNLYGLRVLDPRSSATNGTISTLDCSLAVVSGSLVEGIESAGVTVSIPYSGGNGGAYGAQLIRSTGVNGLSARLAEGSFASGNGMLLFTIQDIPASIGLAVFSINVGGQSCSITLPVSMQTTTGLSAASCGSTNVLNPAIGYGSMIDQDGNTYRTVAIGHQVWMAENLKTGHFLNGDPILVETDQTAWNNLTTPATCWYANDSAANDCPFGKLYNHYTIQDPRGLCPSGWHVPSDGEWNELIKYLDPLSDTTAFGITSSVAGGMLKSVGTQYWMFPNFNASNSTGFSAVGGALRTSSSFVNFGRYGIYWSTSENATNEALVHTIVNAGGFVYRDYFSYNNGYSVRCLKN